MNTKFNIRLTMLVILLLLSIFSSQVINAQDAEKQKIITIIQDEIDAYVKKDRARWASHWIQSDQTRINFANAFAYDKVIGWDSLNAGVNQYFNASDNPPIGTKSDFVVNIKGSIAIVDLIGKREESTSDEVVILEKKNKTWKILRMFSFEKSTYEATPANIEAMINWQGYQLLSTNKVDEAIKIFALNTELFPEAWNTWDSLGEAYAKKGEKDIAIGYYKKSIMLNPKNENGKKIVAELAK
jgi:tetratricopeptide (TPR) repeat protein